MDFGSWTGSILKATEGLKGLDEMAAEDDYVHSDSLNVKRHEDESQDQEMVPLTLTTNDITSSKSYERDAEHERNDDAYGHGPLHQPNISHPTPTKTIKTPLRPTVQRTTMMAPAVLEIEAPPESPENVNSSFEEENETASRPVRSNRSKNSNGKHRFLEDLDERLAKDNVPIMSPTMMTVSDVMTPSVRATLSTSSKSAPAKAPSSNWSVFGMMKNGQSNNSEESKTGRDENDEEEGNLPPLSRQRIYKSISSAPTKREEDLNNVTKVSSSGMLDADDLLALEQMKHLSESQNENSWAEILQQHPRESFIALTMVLSIAVYFCMRKFSKEDDID